jgi:hypothetical protein
VARRAHVQGPTAVRQQVSDVPLSRDERRLIWKTLHDNSSSVALAALDENQADGTASSVNLQSARQVTPEGRSGPDSAGEGDDPVRCDARKEVDPSRLAIGFAHVLRGVYGVDSLWLEQSKIKLLRDIGSIVADSYNHIKP